MTRLFNDPARFADDMVAGFAAAHPDRIRAVPGGVVRSQRPPQGKVAVLTGGGSGHYPAFCGVVGPGFADGSVIGNVFTSPSADRAHSVALEAHSGAGVLFLFGNYAGDRMNFGLAAQRLQSEGIPARCFAVTDDIASAPAGNAADRRGIAGGFTVFKTASAAAEEGASLDAVVRVAERTNARTRTLGVAFAGCTLPGEQQPLFTVPSGKLGLGLGIHGEPGVSESELASADDLARTLVEGLLAERPAAAEGNRVAALLNGLGATKYEELYVLWGRVAELLADEGVELVRPEVGELVTSLDMAGCSLTLTWLDDELERLWLAPTDTPAHRRGAVAPRPSQPSAEVQTHPGHRTSADPTPAPAATGGAAATCDRIAAAVRAAHTVLHAQENVLGRLDAVAGDGDHGRGMCKGVDAALEAAAAAHDRGLAPAALLAAAGDTWAAEAGGTSGALWGAALRAAGAELPHDREPEPGRLTAAAEAALAAVTSLGGAAPGDKTLVDALHPFVTAFAAQLAEGAPPRAAFAEAAARARKAAEATADLRPRLGRARPLAERSIGSPDPGAISLAMVLGAVADA